MGPRAPRSSVKFSSTGEASGRSSAASSAASVYASGRPSSPGAIAAAAARAAAASFGGEHDDGDEGSEGLGLGSEGGEVGAPRRVLRRRASNLSENVRRGSRRVTMIAGNLLSRLQVRSLDAKINKYITGLENQQFF